MINCLKNLRLLADCKEGEYLITDNAADIYECVPESFVTTLSSFVYRETWESNLRAIHKIYCIDVPGIIDDIEKDESQLDVDKVKTLLLNSRQGLLNLKKVFNHKSHLANIDCICEDYLDVQCDFLNGYSKLETMDCSESTPNNSDEDL